MARRFQRSAEHYGKDQSGCMRSFISIFDFRQDRPTRKLLTYKKSEGTHVFDAGNSRNRFEILTTLDVDSPHAHDGDECAKANAGKPSVKKLIEEEIFHEQDSKKEIKKAVMDLKKRDSVHKGRLRRHLKITKKTRKKSCNMNTHDSIATQNLGSAYPFHQNSEQQSENNSEKLSDFEEKLAEEIKKYLGQTFNSGKDLVAEDLKIHHLRELMDALEISNFKEEMFLKLVQNPNSHFMKYVQTLQESHREKVKESKSLEGSEVKQSEQIFNHKKRNFFSRKFKSQERKPWKGYENFEDSNGIVNMVPNQRIGSSHLFLSEIKRKFKHALGKERNEISSNGSSNTTPYGFQNSGHGEKRISKEKARNSPRTDHFYSERIAKLSIGCKRGARTSKPKNSEISTVQEIDSYPGKSVTDFYIEAKRHLSEILSNGDGDIDVATRQRPNTLGRILSIPEYNFSPIESPKKDQTEKIFSACSNSGNVDEKMLSPRQENSDSHVISTKSQVCVSSDSPGDEELPPLDEKQNISNDLVYESRTEETSCADEDGISSEGEVEIVRSTEIVVVEEERSSPGVPSDLTSSSVISDDQNGAMTHDISDEDRCSECLKQDLFEQILVSSPIASNPINRGVAEDLGSSKHIPERTSPISVLETQFSDDEISPGKVTSKPDELPTKPLQIRFEEHDGLDTDQSNCTKPCMVEKDLIFDHVKTVLHASGLNWDEFCTKSLSSEQLLDPSLFPQLGLFSDQLQVDQKLLFDCINEVLMEVCQRHSPWLSSIKPYVGPVPDMKVAILKVSEGVHWHMSALKLPHNLEQIVEKDLKRSRTWMDLQLDTEIIGTETSEAIFGDLMEDTILSCVHERLQHGFNIPVELKEDQSNINL